MIRRLILVLASLFILSACGATDTAAISLEDRSISDDELVQLAEVITEPGSLQFAGLNADSIVDATPIRGSGVSWLQFAALEIVLERQGVVMSDDERLQTEAALSAAITPETLTELVGTETYEALVRNQWIVELPEATLNGLSIDEVIAVMNTADVSSRLGEWDPDALSIVPLQ